MWLVSGERNEPIERDLIDGQGGARQCSRPDFEWVVGLEDGCLERVWDIRDADDAVDGAGWSADELVGEEVGEVHGGVT